MMPLEKTSISLPADLNSVSKSTSAPHVSASASGDIESHLSVANSQRRLRTTILYSSEVSAPKTFLKEERELDSQPAVSSLHWIYNGHSAVRYWFLLKPWMKWSVGVYCLFCILFFSWSIIARIHTSPLSVSKQVSGTSFLDFLSAEQRLLRISSLGHSITSFDPFVLRGQPDQRDSVTACIWLKAEDIEHIPRFASRWGGPASILLQTNVAPTPAAKKWMLNRLQTLYDLPDMLVVSVHVLYLRPGVEDSPNAYLNLARLFSETSYVVMVPARIPSFTGPNSSFAQEVVGASLFRPVLLESRLRSSARLPLYAPLLLAQDYPTWCTERFFYSSSRVTNWEQCLWQFWLDSFGTIGVVAHDGRYTLRNAAFMKPTVIAKLSRRLIMKFRSEMCDRVSKQLYALQSVGAKPAAAERNWLSNFCRETLLAERKNNVS